VTACRSIGVLAWAGGGGRTDGTYTTYMIYRTFPIGPIRRTLQRSPHALTPPGRYETSCLFIGAIKCRDHTGFRFVTKRSASGRAKLELGEEKRPWRVDFSYINLHDSSRKMQDVGPPT
jgi:hypothetical protein